jgi:predicted DNA-binding antitoxin AbrB/MazE fold protein
MALSITVIYEKGVFRPLEKLDLPERRKFQIVIQPVPEEPPAKEQQTLADVLGFDPSDEEKLREVADRQYEAIMAIAGTGRSGRTDISRNVDKYLYVKDW